MLGSVGDLAGQTRKGLARAAILPAGLGSRNVGLRPGSADLLYSRAGLEAGIPFREQLGQDWRKRAAGCGQNPRSEAAVSVTELSLRTPNEATQRTAAGSRRRVRGVGGALRSLRTDFTSAQNRRCRSATSAMQPTPNNSAEEGSGTTPGEPMVVELAAFANAPAKPTVEVEK